ncbi:MAG TPA: acyl-CoA dehydrogenase family protein [Xanthobacteraceae bacterium]|nr:acyl-CoA dehydrogenase family protein [Xanthobacteraceae bacterium]
MLDVGAVRQESAVKAAGAPVVDAVRRIAARDLAPIVRDIDAGLYPETVLRAFGAAGAYASHLPQADRERADLSTAIAAMAAAGEHCLATAFCMWCQDALAWYVFASDNAALKDAIGRGAARGEVLGGTGLSNPMKTFFGIETMRLKARRVAGGFTVRGALPWVSNLGPDHYFGAVFEVEDAPRRFVMAIVPCASEGVKLVGDHKFVALDGTRTFGVQLRDVFIPDRNVLADPIEPYLKRIRAGFVLLQAGMAIGLIRGCIDLMRQMKTSHGHVNKYLEMQPEDFAEKLSGIEATVAELAATPFATDPAYWRRVIETRLAAGEATVAAAHWAMLHCGARGYVTTGAAQRRLRESYFVAIVTPATKQLRKMLADMPR